MNVFLDQCLGGRGGREGNGLRCGRSRRGVFEREYGENIGGGDPSVREVRRDEETVPDRRKRAYVEQTVSFRV